MILWDWTLTSGTSQHNLNGRRSLQCYTWGEAERHLLVTQLFQKVLREAKSNPDQNISDETAGWAALRCVMVDSPAWFLLPRQIVLPGAPPLPLPPAPAPSSSSSSPSPSPSSPSSPSLAPSPSVVERGLASPSTPSQIGIGEEEEEEESEGEGKGKGKGTGEGGSGLAAGSSWKGAKGRGRAGGKARGVLSLVEVIKRSLALPGMFPTYNFGGCCQILVGGKALPGPLDDDHIYSLWRDQQKVSGAQSAIESSSVSSALAEALAMRVQCMQEMVAGIERAPPLRMPPSSD